MGDSSINWVFSLPIKNLSSITFKCNTGTAEQAFDVLFYFNTTRYSFINESRKTVIFKI